MLHTPSFTAPQRFSDPAVALAQVQKLYGEAVRHLQLSMQAFVDATPSTAGEPTQRVRACYPFVRLHARSANRLPGTGGHARLSYGFVAGPGRFETTLTRPDLYADYYLEQFRLLLDNHGGELEVGVSHQPIPVHFAFAEDDHVEGELTPAHRTVLRDVFDLPDLTVMDDGIANATF